MPKKKGESVHIGRQKNETHRIAAQPQKRGAKNYFMGTRLALLELYSDRYIMLRGKSRLQFWHDFYSDWWKRYPWRLPDDEEPPADDPKKMEELAHVGENENAKSKVEKKLRTVSSFAEIFQLKNDRHDLPEDQLVVQLPSHRSQLPPRGWLLDSDPQSPPQKSFLQTSPPHSGPAIHERESGDRR